MPSTTAVGDQLEDRIFDLFRSEIDAGRFPIKKACCKLFKKKGYFSRDRNSRIIFDVAIEVSMPGAPNPSLRWLIECKNIGRPVSVDDVEEFFAKIQQVGAANSKAVVATTSAFQSGAREYARAKGIGLVRYFGPRNFKWELRRSASAGSRSTSPDAEYTVTDGLTRPDFRSEIFDLFIQTPVRVTTSLSDFVDDVLTSAALSPTEIRRITNPRSAQVNAPPWKEKDELEALAEETLHAVSYSSDAVPLDAICKHEAQRTGLVVRQEVTPPEIGHANPPLGRIQFDPLEIEVFKSPKPTVGRYRFTLAHELAHHLLGHGEYMHREFCDERDFVLRRTDLSNSAEIARLEYQANYFASSLLLPRANFIADFRQVLHDLGIQDRGYGALFVDQQRCNIDNHNAVTSLLKTRYRVSRAATRIRLESLDLLRRKEDNRLIRAR